MTDASKKKKKNFKVKMTKPFPGRILIFCQQCPPSTGSEIATVLQPGRCIRLSFPQNLSEIYDLFQRCLMRGRDNRPW